MKQIIIIIFAIMLAGTCKAQTKYYTGEINGTKVKTEGFHEYKHMRGPSTIRFHKQYTRADIVVSSNNRSWEGFAKDWNGTFQDVVKLANTNWGVNVVTDPNNPCKMNITYKTYSNGKAISVIGIAKDCESIMEMHEGVQFVIGYISGQELAKEMLK